MSERKSSQAHIDANARYAKKAYDLVSVVIRKDAELNGEAIRAHAKAMGESLNSFITRAVAEAVEHDLPPKSPKTD